MMVDRETAIDTINKLASSQTPFFFITDFEGKKAFITTDLNSPELQFTFHGNKSEKQKTAFTFEKNPLAYSSFRKAFNYVTEQINFGNSYLTNLTFKTPLKTNLTLDEIYATSEAKYKVLFKDQFVVFSPETFIKIKDGHIYSYPMKGTINAHLPNAAEQIKDDPKEKAEHITIVDLIRNDLSQVATNVEVTRFRYLSQIKTHEKSLLQVSSEIKGTLPTDFSSHLGNIIFALLPAGSISGAPKEKTVSIIQQAETYERGFYTGICGYYDGENLDSAVMIRFIEKEGERLFYKSGGGITSFSDPQKEYQEFIDKIYIPL